MKTAIAHDLLGSNFSLILAILLLFTIVIYIPVIIIFFFRRKTQPIRHRSPYLILTTLICKLLIKLASFLSGISISMIFYLDFKAESEWKSFTCKFYSFVGNVLHFTLILPFIFR